MRVVYEEGALPPGLAMVMIALAGLALVLAVLVGWARARRRDELAAAAEASISPTPPPLVEGLDVVLGGIVRHCPDSDVAVKVNITQHGSESESSGSWTHSWTEIDREVVLAPFLLELPSGELVRVDPPRNVEVADALDQKVLINRQQRVLSAELVPGEKIFARGRLMRSDQAAPSSAYRDVTWGWALGPADGRMLLSSEPLGAGLRERAVFHRSYAVAALLLLLATQATLLGYYPRLVGETRMETVDGRQTWQTTNSDDEVSDHFALYVRGDRVAVDASTYYLVERGDAIAVRFASEDNWALGTQATVRWWHAGLHVIAAGIFWLWYRYRRRSSRPWFRRTVSESGPGRLPPIDGVSAE